MPDKKTINDAVVRWALTIVLGVSAYLFWSIGYPHAMGYQEQFQLFLFDYSYFAERIAVPGGLGTYVAEFLTQFYNSPAIGALVIALVYVLMQRMTWMLAKRNLRDGDNGWWAYILSFVPSFMIWWQMGDESTMLAYTVSLALVLAVMLLLPRSRIPAVCYTVIAMPLLYWFVGPLVFVFAIYSGVRIAKGSRTRLTSISLVVLAAVYALAWVLLSALFVPYPLNRLFAGLFYYRFVEVIPYSLIVIAVVTLLLTIIRIHLPIKNTKILMPLSAIVVAGVAVVMIPKAYDELKYDLVEYDWLVRQQRWNDVIAKSERKQPTLPMSVCATNLALGMTGQLGDRCFDFFQNGAEGLLPEFERNFSTTLLTGDVYFLLGLVNTSQRYAFEAMESVPNYNKSARAIKRLAETNLINGQYKVARKYLTMLQKTIYYRNWAERRLEMIDNPRLIDENNVYGYLRKVRLEDDFLFSDKELDKMLGQLLMRNKENMMAMQYLLVYPLLNRDMPTFMEYFSYVQTLKKYTPRACVEAVALAYAQQNKLPQKEIQRYQMSNTWKYLLGN